MRFGHGLHPRFSGLHEDFHVVLGIEPQRVRSEGGAQIDVRVRVVPPVFAVRIIRRPGKGQLIFVEHRGHLDGSPRAGHQPTKLGHIAHVSGDENIGRIGISHQRGPACCSAMHAPFPMASGQGVEDDGVSCAFKHTRDAKGPSRVGSRVKGVADPDGQGRGHGLDDMRRSQSFHR